MSDALLSTDAIDAADVASLVDGDTAARPLDGNLDEGLGNMLRASAADALGEPRRRRRRSTAIGALVDGAAGELRGEVGAQALCARRVLASALHARCWRWWRPSSALSPAGCRCETR